MDNFTATLKNNYTGYTGVTCKDLLTHLLNTYANIDGYDLKVNRARMNTPYDLNQPTKTLYRQTTEAVVFANTGKIPYTSRQIVNAAVSNIAVSGVFTDNIKEWRKKPVLS